MSSTQTRKRALKPSHTSDDKSYTKRNGIGKMNCLFVIHLQEVNTLENDKHQKIS